jgi:methionine-S-sulfoxide reductase
MKPFLPLVALLVAALIAQSPARAQGDKPAEAPASGLSKAVFAGGCFWCMQYAFDRAPGVKKTVVGYSGGKTAMPSYESVSTGATGHAEAIEVFYDPKATSYEKLLDVFWSNIDPTALNRQFADAGTQYRTAIFYGSAEEKQLAEKSRDALAKSGKFNQPIVTQIVPAAAFYDAEEHHQEYYKKEPTHFQMYEVGSGRVRYLRDKWGADKH